MKLKDILLLAKSELEDLTTVSDPDFRLEEAIYKDDEKKWEVIVSYLVENTNKPSGGFVSLAAAFPFDRMYKKLEINDKNEVTGFYMYDYK